jgi:hypothetical protein
MAGKIKVMKKIIFYSLAILFMATIFQSCNSNSSNGYKSLADSVGSKDTVGNNSSSVPNQTVDQVQSLRLADSLGYTKISVFLPETIGIPKDGVNLIQSVLINMLTQNGVCGTGGHPRFVLTPMITQINQDITSTAPTMYSNTYDVTFFIADAVNGDIFSSMNTKMVGVGQSSLKAFINAFSGINIQDVKFQNFIKQGTTRMNEFFIKNCTAILKESNLLASKQEYVQALTLLESVPSSSACYDKISKTMLQVFKQYIDNDCNIALSNMKVELGKSNDPTASGYNESAMIYYSMISPKANCYKEADALYKSYINKLNPKEKRDWEHKMQQYKDDLDKNNQDRELKILQAQLSIEGNQELLDVYRKQYNYEKLPWIRQWIHLGSFDPFDGTK